MAITDNDCGQRPGHVERAVGPQRPCRACVPGRGLSRSWLGFPMLVEEFDKIGLGQGFRYVTGVVEIIGAIAILAPG